MIDSGIEQLISKIKSKLLIYSRLEDLNLDEITTIINSYEPVQIKDWPKRPYKAILIVIYFFIK